MAPPARRRAKGLILAAGLGTRLRPLTERWPKPLIPFAGTTALELALWRLAKAGIDDVAVNAHYMADEIVRAVATNPFRQRIHLSIERPDILGTGGVYNPLREWLGKADLVVINGDVISTIDVASLLALHQAAGGVATMALLSEVIPGESGVFFDASGVRAIGRTGPPGTRAGNFACAQVISQGLLDLLPRVGSFDIISKGYQPALAKGLGVSACMHEGFWHDLRTPSYFAAALADYLTRPGLSSAPASDEVGVMAARQSRGLATTFVAGGLAASAPCRIKGPVLIDDSAHVDLTAELGPNVVVDRDVTVGSHAVVRDAVLLPGAVVPAGAVLSKAVVGPGISLAI